MPTRFQIINEARECVQNQRDWMLACGGTLAGYIRRYGSKDDANHLGAGAEAIYAADLAALRTVEKRLAILRGEE